MPPDTLEASSARPFPVPANEAARLDALARYGLIGTLPQERFSRIARLAARIIGTPVALVTVMGEQYQDFLGSYGTDLTGTDRQIALCNYTVLGDELNIVPDLRDDPRYADNPLVTGPIAVRAYAGVPLHSPDGLPIGALCALDFAPHDFTDEDRAALADLGALASEEIERTLNEQRETERRDAIQAKGEAEESLRELNRTLEARVEERTVALEAANRELGLRNRELQEFAYVASHDLQEPLRKIQAFSGLVMSEHADALGPQGIHYLQRIEDAASRMSHLVRDLLALSRVSTQGQVFTPVSLGHTLDVVMSDLEIRLAETHGRVEVDGLLPTLEADPVQMHQLLLNLIGNALKFSRPETPPRVQVRVERDVPGHAMRLVVEDNGVGFDQKYAERIFAPFQRLHGRAEYEGTGMGLAIVRRIAERHGGAVYAEGRPGEGARITVTLPVAGG